MQIDKIRKIDVPWKIYLIIYIALMLLIFGLVFVLLAVVKVKLVIAVILSVFMVLANTFVFGMITFFGFKEEEIKDAKKLAELYN